MRGCVRTVGCGSVKFTLSLKASLNWCCCVGNTDLSSNTLLSARKLVDYLSGAAIQLIITGKYLLSF